MSRSHVDAMSSLEQANPLEDALRWWTRSEEDALLESVLAENPEASTPDVSSVLSGPPRQLTRTALIGLGALVAAAATLAAVLAGSGSPSAFAAWTATTTTPPASQLAASASSCQHQYGLTLGLLGRPAAATLPGSLPPLVLTDSRGPFEMLVFSGPTGEGVCLWDSSKVLALTGSNGETLAGGLRRRHRGARGRLRSGRWVVGADLRRRARRRTRDRGHARSGQRGPRRSHGAERLLCGLVALPVRRHRSRGHFVRRSRTSRLRRHRSEQPELVGHSAVTRR